MSNDSNPNTINAPNAKGAGWKLPAACFVLLALGLAGFATWKCWPTSNRFYTDGQGLHVDANEARIRDVLWREPQSLSAIINIEGDDYEPQLDEANGALYFVRGKTGEDADIYVSHRSNEDWSQPEPLNAINTEYDDLGPRLTLDGLTLYFYSDRPGGLGGYDLWSAHRSTRDEPFGEPVNLGSHVNSSWDEYSPAPTPSGDRIYFSSNRPVGEMGALPKPKWSATLRENRRRTGYDLYVASVTGAGFGDAESLDALNTSADEGAPAVSPNGDFVYFSSNRSGGAGGFDLYRVRDGESGFGDVEWLGSSVNGPADELDPVLSMEGFELHFSSNRMTDTSKPLPHETTYDIYRTSSREVFVATEVLQAEFNWAGLLDILGPGLLALLLLLLLLLLSRMLLSSKWRGRLSLIMRCLLASLFLHLLLLTLFMFWQVTTSISDLFERDGGVRVALAAPARDTGLTAQIRGGFAEDPLPQIQVEQFQNSYEHEVIPARLAASHANLPRSVVKSLAKVESRSQITDAVPTYQPETLRSAPLSPPELSPPSELELAIPKPSQPKRMTEAVAELPEANAGSVDVHRGAMPPRNTKSRLADMSSPIAPVQLTSKAMTIADSQTQPLKGATSPTSPHAVPAHALNFPAHDSEDIALPQSNRKQPNVVEREMPLSTAIDPVDIAPVRTAFTAKPNPDSIKLAERVVESKPVELSYDHINAGGEADRVVDAHPTLRPPTNRVETSISLERPEFELPAVRSAVVATQDESDDALPRPAGGDLMQPKLQLASPNIPQFQPSQELPGLGRTIDVSQPDDTSSQSRLHDAELAIAQRTRVQPIDVTALEPAEFDLAPPATPKPTTNAIGGQVTDAHTGEPIKGATVRLDLSDVDAVTAATDAEGAYALQIPHVPDHFAISTSFEGYVPASVDISKESVRERSLTVNFKLRRVDLSTVALEAVPDVHHLGDDRFSGSVNSQFQKHSEGGSYIVAFELSELQIPPHMMRCELTMLTRGVQMRHPIYINGRQTPLRIANSPRDGSFGLFQAEIDARWLTAGKNTFAIKARSRGNDIDDFEFVNVQLHFAP